MKLGNSGFTQLKATVDPLEQHAILKIDFARRGKHHFFQNQPAFGAVALCSSYGAMGTPQYSWQNDQQPVHHRDMIPAYSCGDTPTAR